MPEKEIFIPKNEFDNFNLDPVEKAEAGERNNESKTVYFESLESQARERRDARSEKLKPTLRSIARQAVHDLALHVDQFGRQRHFAQRVGGAGRRPGVRSGRSGHVAARGDGRRRD